MMNKEGIPEMITLLERIIEATKQLEKKYADQLSKVHPKFEKSAINLLHYRAFRRFDIKDLQNGLSQLGLSRLGKSEAHLLASLNVTKSVLKSFLEPRKITVKDAFLSIEQGNGLLPLNTDALLGEKPKKRPVRIMVTQPTETAQNMDLVQEMVQSGMDMARVNCAHDVPEVWEKIIKNIRLASRNSSKSSKVCMDLGGPKIRTGTIYNGSDIVKYKPSKDRNGKVSSPLRISLVSDFLTVPKSTQNCLQLPQDWIERLETGDTIKFFDARGKHRKFIVRAIFENGVEVYAHKTCYLKRGMEVSVYKEAKMYAATIKEVRSSSDRFLALKRGDTVILEKKGNREQKLESTKKARVSCTSDAVFEHVRIGERVLFDDGKITGEIIGLSLSTMDILITYAKTTGSILREDKGINFPDTDLKISGLTEIDKNNLPFIAKHADVVNLSFVNRKDDVQELIEELGKLPEGDQLGIILKIETKSGFDNLTEILLTAMQVYPIGVMIARGDLAVECGWENMAMIQEEILSLCMASHIPVIWATQVLENLAKKGIPSRPEITDAAMSQRAECVMLNKGPHIVQTIKMLDHILAGMSHYQYKKSPMFPLWT
ncbi:pyruvate kinase [Ulvibacterium sp.]|uniref:pyruvate kinase n=1 Tax=Ulvibacterium sp. TaxID=2665914 RepID=UPI00262E5366|nr:pyruvate kinase [Ulvibacterium sp.]